MSEDMIPIHHVHTTGRRSGKIHGMIQANPRVKAVVEQMRVYGLMPLYLPEEEKVGFNCKFCNYLTIVHSVDKVTPMDGLCSKCHRLIGKLTQL